MDMNTKNKIYVYVLLYSFLIEYGILDKFTKKLINSKHSSKEGIPYAFIMINRATSNYSLYDLISDSFSFGSEIRFWEDVYENWQEYIEENSHWKDRELILKEKFIKELKDVKRQD